MSFAVGSLVRARGREWVVLPESSEEMVIVRPLGGTDDEVTGIYLPLEAVEPARFAPPDPAHLGDHRSCRLLRDAVRLGFRSSAGPFRSFARIAVEPRPYQLVPLLLALRQDPVRLLLADDVGVGKTVEAGLIARELLDRGEVDRLAVLCPPQLAEQWQAELRDKFHIEAEVVLPGTVTRLERECRPGQSLFEVYPHVIVSTDFIKADRRRDEFLRACPELVLVDEAHTCAFGAERGGRHQRHRLVAGLAADPHRHLVLVTATPHSGKEEAFRSLLALLDPSFTDLPEDLTRREHEGARRRLAAHFIQRRREDIRRYLDADTPFPEREDPQREETYKLSPDYRRLLERILRYVRESVVTPDGNQRTQRVRWWSALALLRGFASSPAALAATLRSRAAVADAETAEDADEIGRRTVLDLMDGDAAEGSDVAPGSDPGADDGDTAGERRRLLEMAREADAILGAKDEKLSKAVRLVKEILADGFRPILFCRFIPTAEYVAAALRERLPKDVAVAAVTGALPPAEREERVMQLAASPQRVLVCTDCLSEGVNLQEHFDAVLHYDLSWNPTRHEQREGRVDRYGQPSPKVRVIAYWGLDNQIDGIVLDVLIRKHRAIRGRLGISVPVPLDTEEVIEAVLEGLLLRKAGKNRDEGQLLLPGLEDVVKPQASALHGKWDAAWRREERARSLFAQETIRVDEVARELEAVRSAIGSAVDVERFSLDAVRALHGLASGHGEVEFDLREMPRAVRDAIGGQERLAARFALPVREEQVLLTRTHPVVEGLAGYIMERALDPPVGTNGFPAHRCGAIRTRAVGRRATLLLVRFRYHILSPVRGCERPLLAEDCRVLAFAGSPRTADWLGPDAAEVLLTAEPAGNIHPEQAAEFVQRVLDDAEALGPRLHDAAREQADQLLAAHLRVRAVVDERSARTHVEPQLPADLLGVYIYLPAGV